MQCIGIVFEIAKLTKMWSNRKLCSTWDIIEGATHQESRLTSKWNERNRTAYVHVKDARYKIALSSYYLQKSDKLCLLRDIFCIYRMNESLLALLIVENKFIYHKTEKNGNQNIQETTSTFWE